jgi:hypothetical protein
MNRWTGEQVQRIVVLAIGTLALVGAIWFGLVLPLQGLIRAKIEKIDVVRKQIKTTETGLTMSEQNNSTIRQGRAEIGALEVRMAQGDLYRWVLNYLRDLQARNNVVVSDYGPPRDTNVRGSLKVPHKAVEFTIAGSAYYHDVGAFLADLENSSPFIRLSSLTLQAAASGPAGSPVAEKLTFHIDFSTLVKPAGPVR